MARRSREFAIKVGTQGADRTKRDFDDVAAAEKRAGGEAEELGRKGGRLGGIFDGVGRSIGGIVAGIVSIQAVRAAIEEVIAAMQRVLDLRKQITQEGLSLREMAFPLASQLGDTSQAGQERATEIVGRFAGAVRGGAEAVSLGVSADVFGPPGERTALTPEDRAPTGLTGSNAERNIEIFRALGAFGTARRFDAATMGQFAKVLDQAGALTGKDDALRGAAVLSEAIQSSASVDPAQFMGAFASPAISMLNAGVPLETVAARFVQFVNTQGSERQAGERFNIFAQGVAGKKFEDVMEARGRDITGMSREERVNLLSNVWSTFSTAEKRGVFEPGQLAVIEGSLGVDQVKAANQLIPRLEGITPDASRAMVEETLKSQVFVRHGRELREEVESEERARTSFWEDEFRERAEKRFDRFQEAGNATWTWRGRHGWSEEAMKESFLGGVMREEMSRRGIDPNELMREFMQEHPGYGDPDEAEPNLFASRPDWGGVATLGWQKGWMPDPGVANEFVRYASERIGATPIRQPAATSQPATTVHIGTVVNMTEQGKTVTSPRTSGPQM